MEQWSNVGSQLRNNPHFRFLLRKFSCEGGFIQWHMVVICIWYAVFVTSQFDVIFMFPNQRFREIC